MTIPIALQLYTLRDALAQDFAGGIEKIADIGFIGVETAFFPEGFTVAEATRIIQANGLKIMAAHCELPLGDDQRPVLEMMAEEYDTQQESQDNSYRRCKPQRPQGMHGPFLAFGNILHYCHQQRWRECLHTFPGIGWRQQQGAGQQDRKGHQPRPEMAR